ncbi:MAG: DUF92 domain-containing protein [Clostridia bacterium]|nr:DUF92 domain-containing protein [Clostridia bacterium]MBO5092012.1 DUF92 domain-containing protein [Clostridia bacterium]MBP3494672.1 DUF92 domain-containing protein [Clostridia bacterium]
MKIALGYTIFFAYMLILMVVGEIVAKKTTLNKEVVRKVQHILTSLSWLIGVIFFGASIHIVIVNLLGCIVLTITAFTGITTSSERTDAKRSYGLMYFGLGTLIVIIIAVYGNKDLFLLSGIPYYCLALGDGFAPLIARMFKKHNPKITENKTLLGTLSVFLVSALVALIFNFALDLGYSALFILSIGALTSVLELFGMKGTDNLLIELGVFGYVALNHFGYLSIAVQVCVLISPIIVCLSLYKKSLTLTASLVSFVYMTLATFFAGSSVLVLTVSLFVLSEIVSKLTRKKRDKSNQVYKKETRGSMQILANCVVALVFSMLYYTFKEPIFIYCVYVALAEEFADSMASDVGRLSRKRPIDILRFRRIDKGLSGGVSLFGTIASLVGVCVSVAIWCAYHNMPWAIMLIVAGVSFLGTIIDSILGSGVQALYKCNMCQAQTEKPLCCGNRAVLVKGVRIIDNTAVNLLSGIITTLIAFGIFKIIL